MPLPLVTELLHTLRTARLGSAGLELVSATGATGPLILFGTATPEGAVTAPAGSLFLRTDGNSTTSLYVKGTGSGATGWSLATLGVGSTSITADVVNNNASANTIADVTGLSFPVVNGQRYWFRFVIPYTSAATTTGSRWSINGPTVTDLAYTSRYPLTATTETFNYATAYDIPAASNATSLTTGNVAVIEGHIRPSADGTVIARFASEVSSSAITALRGAFVQYMPVG